MVSFCSNMACRNIIQITIVVILLWRVSMCWGAPTPQLDDVLNRWLAAQTNITSWNADFTQTRHLRALVQPLVSTGKVWFAAPANFRWQIGENPIQTIAIRDGDLMQVVYPKAKRVERYRFDTAANKEMKDTLVLLQTGFPRSKPELQNQFTINFEGMTNKLYQLALEPKSANARRMLPMVKVLLETNNFTLAGTELHFVDGSRMVNRFSNINTNISTDPNIFKFAPPGDYKITEPFK